MTHDELVQYVSKELKISKADAKESIEVVFKGICEGLKKDWYVNLGFFGSIWASLFKSKEKTERMRPVWGYKLRARISVKYQVLEDIYDQFEKHGIPDNERIKKITETIYSKDDILMNKISSHSPDMKNLVTVLDT